MLGGLEGGAGAAYAATGRAFPLRTRSLLELYTAHAASHYEEALGILVILLAYVCFLSPERFFNTVLLRTIAIGFAVNAWLLAPALFNPHLRYTCHLLPVPHNMVFVNSTLVPSSR